ncbi:MAG: glycosyltransferase family 1 protein [Actinomycetota bacterium]
MSLRVAVNLLWLVAGDVGGTESYATRLLRGVAQLDPIDVDVTLYALPGFADAHPDLAGHFELETAPIDGARRPVRVAAETTWLAARTRRVDVVHHVGGTIPLLAPSRRMLTIHDLQYLEHPEWFSEVKRRYLATMVPMSARRADLVTAVSEPVAAHVGEAFDVPPEQIAVVPHAVPRLPTDGPLPPELPDRYVVFPARSYPHKNHDTLLDALLLIPEAERPHLVLTGGPGRHHDELTRRLADPALARWVHHLGQVDEPVLGAVVAGAAGLVFPSRYEGFGAPVVEAMALDVPVVSSTASPLPDLVAGVGSLLDPDDVDGWAAAMVGLVSGRRPDGVDVEAGRARARVHRPEIAAETLVAAWRRAMGPDRSAQ